MIRENKTLYAKELKSTVSFSKLQREAISMYKKLFKEKDGVVRIKSAKDGNISFVFNFSPSNKENWISIQLEAENSVTGYTDLIKRVDFKFKQTVSKN